MTATYLPYSGPGYPDFGQLGTHMASGFAGLAAMQAGADRARSDSVELAIAERRAERVSQLDHQKFLLSAAAEERKAATESMRNMMEMARFDHEQTKMDREVAEWTRADNAMKLHENLISTDSGYSKAHDYQGSGNPLLIAMGAEMILGNPAWRSAKTKEELQALREAAAAVRTTPITIGTESMTVGQAVAPGAAGGTRARLFRGVALAEAGAMDVLEAEYNGADRAAIERLVSAGAGLYGDPGKKAAYKRREAATRVKLHAEKKLKDPAVTEEDRKEYRDMLRKADADLDFVGEGTDVLSLEEWNTYQNFKRGRPLVDAKETFAYATKAVPSVDELAAVIERSDMFAPMREEAAVSGLASRDAARDLAYQMNASIMVELNTIAAHLEDDSAEGQAIIQATLLGGNFNRALGLTGRATYSPLQFFSEASAGKVYAESTAENENAVAGALEEDGTLPLELWKAVAYDADTSAYSVVPIEELGKKMEATIKAREAAVLSGDSDVVARADAEIEKFRENHVGRGTYLFVETRGSDGAPQFELSRKLAERAVEALGHEQADNRLELALREAAERRRVSFFRSRPGLASAPPEEQVAAWLEAWGEMHPGVADYLMIKLAEDPRSVGGLLNRFITRPKEGRLFPDPAGAGHLREDIMPMIYPRGAGLSLEAARRAYRTNSGTVYLEGAKKRVPAVKDSDLGGDWFQVSYRTSQKMELEDLGRMVRETASAASGGRSAATGLTPTNLKRAIDDYAARRLAAQRAYGRPGTIDGERYVALAPLMARDPAASSAIVGSLYALIAGNDPALSGIRKALVDEYGSEAAFKAAMAPIGHDLGIMDWAKPESFPRYIPTGLGEDLRTLGWNPAPTPRGGSNTPD